MRGSFRRAAVISTACFLGGVLLLGLGDLQVLQGSAPPESYLKAERFHTLFWNAPRPVLAVLHGVIGCHLIAIAAKLALWTEEALYFDGASMLTALACFSTYGVVIVPRIHLLNPDSEQPLYLSLSRTYGAISERLPSEPLSPDQRRETLAVIAAGEVALLAGFGLIVTLQIAEWYVEKSYQRQMEEKLKKSS